MTECGRRVKIRKEPYESSFQFLGDKTANGKYRERKFKGKIIKSIRGSSGMAPGLRANWISTVGEKSELDTEICGLPVSPRKGT